MKNRAQSSHHATPYTFPAPLRGWVETDNPAMSKPGGASVLENWIPTQTGIRMRGGCQTVSNVGAPIIGLIPYDNGVVRRLFAVTADAIKDASAFDGTPAPTMVTGFSGGEPVATQFSTLGKTYLYVVNGIDAPQLFDGGTWQPVTAASAPISITGTGSDRFSHVWSFKSRLFFAVANSMKVWALPVGQVGGAAVDLNLSGVFTKGGRVLFGTSWSSDSGSGFGDRCVIVTDMGEVAIFEGTDPANPAAWALVGRYEITPPLGVNAYVRIGGDVLIATQSGLIPVSGAVSKDPMLLDTVAVSSPIAKSWARAVETNRSGWIVRRWEASGSLLVMRPSGDLWGAFAATGAWFTINAWDIRVAATVGKRLYFGGADGYVRQGDTTGQDGGAPIVARYRGLLQQAPRAGLKSVRLARTTFLTTQDVKCGLRFVSSDRAEWAPAPVPWTPIDTTNRWDRGQWDVMKWDAGSEDIHVETTMWRSVAATGHLIAPEVQVVSDSQLGSICELVSVDAVVDGGGVVG